MQIWSKKSKLSVYAKIWYLDYFEYAGFSGGVPFFRSGPEITLFYVLIKCVLIKNSVPFLGKSGPKFKIV